MDGWMDGWMDGRTDGWMNGRMDGWTDGWMNGWKYVRMYMYEWMDTKGIKTINTLYPVYIVVAFLPYLIV